MIRGVAQDRQAAFNLSSRSHWDAFANHRREVTALLAHRAGRIGVLGAGNANDLDIPTLLAKHRELHLFDIDQAALEFAAGRQAADRDRSLKLHGGIDLTGFSQVISSWTPHSSIASADLDALAEWPANRLASVLPDRFDVVASTCLISQLMESARHSLGTNHASLGQVERAIRTGHLRLLARMAAPRGIAILITEVVSSATVPKLGEVAEVDLTALLSRLGNEGNHFRWVHPSDLAKAVRSDPEIRSRVAGISALRPWRWQLFDRLYLVSGIAIQFATSGVR